MKFAGFIFFSSLEYIAFIYLILVLFRFNVRENMFKFTLYAIVLSFASNSLQMESLQAFSPLIHVAVHIAFFSIFLGLHLFNAAVMVVTGYVVNFIVQWMIVAMVSHLNGGALKIESYTPAAFAVQAATAVVMILCAWVTKFQNGGFSFIREASRFTRSRIFVKENIPFLIFLFFSIILAAGANILYIAVPNPPYLLISILFFAALIALIVISVKKDREADD